MFIMFTCPELLVKDKIDNECSEGAVQDSVTIASLCCKDRLLGLVVKASASRVEDPVFESCLRRDFSRVESHQ